MALTNYQGQQNFHHPAIYLSILQATIKFFPTKVQDTNHHKECKLKQTTHRQQYLIQNHIIINNEVLVEDKLQLESSDDNEKFFKRRGLQKQTMNEIDYLCNWTFKAMIGNITKHDFLICKLWPQEEGKGEIQTSDPYFMRGCPQPVDLPLRVNSKHDIKMREICFCCVMPNG